MGLIHDAIARFELLAHLFQGNRLLRPHPIFYFLPLRDTQVTLTPPVPPLSPGYPFSLIPPPPLSPCPGRHLENLAHRFRRHSPLAQFPTHGALQLSDSRRLLNQVRSSVRSRPSYFGPCYDTFYLGFL